MAAASSTSALPSCLKVIGSTPVTDCRGKLVSSLQDLTDGMGITMLRY